MDVNNAPCKGCSTRTVGCHSKCSAYRAYKAAMHDIFLKRSAESRNDAYFKRKMRTRADEESKNPSGNRMYRYRRYH